MYTLAGFELGSSVPKKETPLHLAARANFCKYFKENFKIKRANGF
jgi:hypothetical protein